MSNTITEAPEAGWYQDPHDDSVMRWWDGAAWTEHAQPIAPAAEPETAAAHATVTGSAGGTWQSNYTEDELALYTGRTTELTAANTTGRTLLEFSGTVPDWRLGRVTAQTGGAWLLAVSSLLWVIFAVFWTLIARAADLPDVPLYLAALIGTALVVGFAALDGRALRARGIHHPSLAWILLTPLGYLIARAVVVRRSSASGIGPLIMYVVSSLAVSTLMVVAVVAPALLHASDSASSSPATSASASERYAVEAKLEAALAANGVTAKVDCSKAQVRITPDSSFTCIATDSGGTAHNLAVKLDHDGNASYAMS